MRPIHWEEQRAYRFVRAGMSVNGTKRTSHSPRVMSVVGDKADMTRR
jgi:hypothetical protein